MMTPPNATAATATTATSSLRRRRPFMKTSELRVEVESLLKDLKHSCRLPLFQQIGNSNSNNNAVDSASTVGLSSAPNCRTGSKRLKREEPDKICSPNRRRWDELLADAATLLPYMTVDEHGTVYRLASILLLGYLIPNSTGNDFYIFQDYCNKEQQQHEAPPPGSNSVESSNLDYATDLFVSMPLQERLESTSRYYAAHEHGEIEICYDEHLEQAFQNFLWKGLAPFLAGRPAHGDEADLIHLIAMVISPHPIVGKYQCNRNSDSANTAWKKAKHLIDSRHSHCFHVRYQHRLQLVHLVADHLVLPEHDASSPLLSSSLVNSPLMVGAVPHLLASLRAFALGAMSPYDAHWGYCGLANTAIQTGQEAHISNEWDALLKRIGQDKSDYGCSCSRINNNDTRLKRTKQNNTPWRTGTLQEKESLSFCPHSGRGELLQRFVSRYNGSRHYADEAFTRNALVSLTDMIQAHINGRLDGPSDNQGGKQLQRAPFCQLAALMYAAKNLFFFLLPPDFKKASSRDAGESDDGVEEDIGRSQEATKRDQLIKCAIQCLQHESFIVVRESAALLVVAFAYATIKNMTDEYALAAYSSVVTALQQHRPNIEPVVDFTYGFEGAVTATARRSYEFASSLLSFLVSHLRGSGNDINKDVPHAEAICRLIGAVSTAQPRAAANQVEALQSLAGTKTGTHIRSHLVAAFLSCRHAHFFSTEDMVPKYLSIAKGMLVGLTDPWTKYKLAKHALITSNFSLAKDLYKSIIGVLSTEDSFLWLSALVKVAEAEETLSRDGACGIPSATPLLHSALTYLSSLSTRSRSIEMFGFQIAVLSLRLDFLDLCSAMRVLGREMRLSGIVPKSNTRSGLHMKNMSSCFQSLASSYFRMNLRFGMFYCQQTRTAIRTMFAVCRFLSRTAGKVFTEKMLPVSTTSEKIHWSEGDCLHPMTMFIRKLDKLVIEPMDEFVNPIVRAAALAQVIDGVLMAPVPFPRGFTAIRPLPVTQLRLSIDPESAKNCLLASTLSAAISDAQTEIRDGVSINEVDVLDVYPYQTYTIYASGKVPNAYFELADVQFSHVTAWTKVSYDSPLHKDDELLAEEQSRDEPRSPMDALKTTFDEEVPPQSYPIFPDGNFLFPVECQPLQEEGFYKLDLQIECRDIRCGEWLLSVTPGSETIFVRVSRHRE